MATPSRALTQYSRVAVRVFSKTPAESAAPVEARGGAVKEEEEEEEEGGFLFDPTVRAEAMVERARRRGSRTSGEGAAGVRVEERGSRGAPPPLPLPPPPTRAAAGPLGSIAAMERSSVAAGG